MLTESIFGIYEALESANLTRLVQHENTKNVFVFNDQAMFKPFECILLSMSCERSSQKWNYVDSKHSVKKTFVST